MKFLEYLNAKGKLQDYRGAIVDFNKAIEINPKDAVAYYNRGIVKIILNQNKIIYSYIYSYGSKTYGYDVSNIKSSHKST